MTNAVKAAVIATVNSALQLVTSFGIDVSDAQQAAIVACVNAALVLWITFTYKQSPKRIPDE